VATIKEQTPFLNLVIANAAYLGEVTTMTARPAEQSLNQLQEELWNKTSFKNASQTVSTNRKGRLLQSQFVNTTSTVGLS
jgi:hypothetical protein